MIRDGEYAATLDRIVEEIAVFLIEQDGKTIDERHLPVEELPSEASEGDRCRLTFADGSIVAIVVQPAETTGRKKRLRKRFNDLARRLDEE